MVIFPLFGSGPLIPVALNSDAAIFSLHYQIDPVMRVSRKWAKLRDDGVAAVDDTFPDFKLELAVRRLPEDVEPRFNFRLGRIELPA